MGARESGATRGQANRIKPRGRYPAPAYTGLMVAETQYCTTPKREISLESQIYGQSTTNWGHVVSGRRRCVRVSQRVCVYSICVSVSVWMCVSVCVCV